MKPCTLQVIQKPVLCKWPFPRLPPLGGDVVWATELCSSSISPLEMYLFLPNSPCFCYYCSFECLCPFPCSRTQESGVSPEMPNQHCIHWSQTEMNHKTTVNGAWQASCCEEVTERAPHPDMVLLPVTPPPRRILTCRLRISAGLRMCITDKLSADASPASPRALSTACCLPVQERAFILPLSEGQFINVSISTLLRHFVICSYSSNLHESKEISFSVIYNGKKN